VTRPGLHLAPLVILLVTVAGAATPRSHADMRSRDQDKAEATFQRVCSNCHPITRVTSTRRSRRQWEEVIETMINSRNAKISDEDYDVILEHLVKTYGRVNVNQAESKDLTDVLGISEGMAGTIVSYRREHGTFADFDALIKVPGIDRDALEKKRDAISF
jgi:competence ComEA-like helix-hairpin-helix protein